LPLDATREYLALDNIRFGQEAAVAAIPEPGNIALVCLGLLFLGSARPRF